MEQQFKEVEINGRKFKIFPPSARDGSWIVGVTFGNQLYQPPENFARAQRIIFEKCHHFIQRDGQEIELLVMDKDGRWLVPEMEYDTDTADALYDEAVEFSLGPTLKRRLLKMLAAMKEAEDKSTQQ